MGKAMELITGRAVAPTATLTTVTMSAGNSATVRAAAPDSAAWLLSAWALNQTAGQLQIRSPLLHDNVRGMRFQVPAGTPRPVFHSLPAQRLFSHDALTIELSGSVTAGDIEQMGAIILYDDLPGVNANFLSPEDVWNRAINIVTVENTITTTAGGGYTGEELLNAESALLRSNTEYARVGFCVRANCNAVRWRSSDWGNLGIGGPGIVSATEITSHWFEQLSIIHNKPLIPVFNSDNIGSLLIDAMVDENATAIPVSTILVQLSK